MEDYFDKIDKLYEKSDLGLNYDLLQMIVENVVNNYIEYKDTKYSGSYDIHDSVEICLEFVKTLNKDYYSLFTKELFSNKIIMFEQTKNNNDKIVGLDGFPLRNVPCVYYNDAENDYRIYVPITHTIEDIYTIVHEISHLIKFNSNDKLVKNLLVEVNSITIEKILSDYLTTHEYEKEDIIKYEINNQNSVFYNALDSLYAITFTNIKKKLGKINFDTFAQYTANIDYFNHYIDSSDIEEYIDKVKTNNFNYLFYLRYVFAQLISVNLISKGYNTSELLNILKIFNNNIYTKKSAREFIINNKKNNEMNDKLNMLLIDINDRKDINQVFQNYTSYTKKLIRQRKDLNVK